MAKSKRNRNVIFEEEHPVQENTLADEFADTKPSMVENIISVILGLAVVVVIGAMIMNVIKSRNNQTTTPSTPEQQKISTSAATYTVAAGDTLWSIAEKKYNDGYKWTEIQKANNLATPESIETGMELIIPEIATATPSVSPAPMADASIMPSESMRAPTGPTGPTGEASRYLQTNGVPDQGPTGPTGTASEKGPTGPTGSFGGLDIGETMSSSTDRTYTVVAGDTLWDICVKRYNDGYRWTVVAQMNNLRNPNLIYAGNVLLMP